MSTQIERPPTETTTNRLGYAIVGLPGTGKSTAGRLLAEHTNGPNIETGDIVRSKAKTHFDKPTGDLSSDELGDYSTMRRETDGGDYVAQDVIETLENSLEFPDKPAIITGMRDSEVPDLFEQFFDRFTIIHIETPFDDRLERLQTRGRQDESEFTAADLEHRDARENEWGTGACIDRADITIPNTGTVDDLDQRLAEVA